MSPSGAGPKALKSQSRDRMGDPSLAARTSRSRTGRRLLPRGAGSIVVFGVKGGRAAGRKFIEALKLVSHLANVGDAKTWSSIPPRPRISR